MSLAPATSNASWTKRKVLGVPLLYLVLGFVVILAAVAWKMKPSAGTAAAVDTQPEHASDTILSGDPGQTLPPMPLGTVTTTVSSPPTDTVPNSSITTNDQWLSRGTMFLADKGVSPGEAQLALQTYLAGNEVTFQQGQWRDAVIRELGTPPYQQDIGPTQADVARMQGPLPRTHIVKNVNENSASKLAGLYYNRTDTFSVQAIADANGGRTSYNVGDSVTVPVLPKPAAPAAPVPQPVVSAPAKPVAKPIAKPVRHYVIKRGDTLSGIALKYYGSASKTNVNKIASANGIRNANLIYAGRTITIPY